MTAAIALITLGAMMLVSAFKGISILDVLRGEQGNPLDPKGGAPSAGTLDTGGMIGGLPAAGSGTFAGPDAELLNSLATVARNNFHLRVSTCRTREQNAAAGGAENSNHLVDANGRCRAFDAAGSAVDMAAFWDYVIAHNYHHQLEEIFYDPKGAWKYGMRIPAIGDHADHVHVGGR